MFESGMALYHPHEWLRMRIDAKSVFYVAILVEWEKVLSSTTPGQYALGEFSASLGDEVQFE